MSLTSYRAAPPRVGKWRDVCVWFAVWIGGFGIWGGLLEDLAATYSPAP
jgi:prolipoprotein diacylglyceryltransferase